MMSNMKFPIKLTVSAVNRIRFIMQQELKNLNLKLRVYIVGGGCGGFQYKFALDDQVSDNDYVFEKSGAFLIIDPMSLQYLFGGVIDYYEGLEGSKFIVVNPNAKMTCSCGSSFSV